MSRITCVLWAIVSVLAFTGCGQVFDANEAPTIQSFFANSRKVDATTGTQDAPIQVEPGSSVLFVCNAEDDDIDPLTTTWTGQNVTSPASEPFNMLTWSAPTQEGIYAITCAVRDSRGGVSTQTVYLRAKKSIDNHPPTATIDPSTATVDKGAQREFVVTAADVDNDPLTYAFFASRGSVAQNATEKSKATYTAPSTSGTDRVFAIVDDGKGASVVAVAEITTP